VTHNMILMLLAQIMPNKCYLLKQSYNSLKVKKRQCILEYSVRDLFNPTLRMLVSCTSGIRVSNSDLYASDFALLFG